MPERVEVLLVGGELGQLSRKTLHELFSRPNALDAQSFSNFFRNIAGLVTREVLFSPELGGGGNQRFETIMRFRFCGWSTHKKVFSGYYVCEKLANRPNNFALKAFCEIIYLLHSKRNVTIGSTFVARRAGM